jgi:hypothetical protein
MLHRLLKACWCAALLAPLGLAARGSAKPPDLPPGPQDAVRPQLLDPDAVGNEDAPSAAGFLPPAHQFRPADFTPLPLLPPIIVGEAQPDGELQFGIGVNSDIGLTGSLIVAQACEEPCEPAAARRELLPVPSLYKLRPSVRRQVMGSLLFSAHPLLALTPTDKLLDCPGDHPQPASTHAPSARQSAGNSKPSCGACPGMCQRPAKRHVYQFTAPDLTGDVLHNLEKVQTAHRLMHLAEHLALSGRVGEALDCFDIVCRLCPGRFEGQVAEVMARAFAPVYGGPAEDAEDGTEELPAPQEDDEAPCPSACPKCERLHAAHVKGVHEQVEGLMKACRLAAEAGRHAKAAELARQAYALDAQRVLADPLVYKMHLLARQRDKGKARHCHPEPGAEHYEPACPRSEDGHGPEAAGPTPPLPPVDAAVIADLERLLEEAEAPHDGGVSLNGCNFDVDCSWTGLRMRGQVPLGGALYHLQFWNGAVSGWVTPNPADLTPEPPHHLTPERVEGGIE